MHVCLLIGDGSDVLYIWRLAIWAKNGPTIGQKYSVLTRILTKKTFKLLHLLHYLIVLLENLHKGTKISAKNLMEANFWIFHFCTIIASKPAKWWFSLLLELWRAINSQKSKNSKKGSHQVFGEVSMWKCSSKMIKWSRRPLAFWRLCFINFGQNTVSLVYFSLKQLTCKCL